MGYDWEKIFKSKTNKELYDIVTGKTVLSKEAEQFAKNELERRHFDFNDMEANKEAWQISKLIEDEEDYAWSKSFPRRVNYIFLNISLLILPAIAYLYFSALINLPISFVWYVIGFTIFLLLLMDIFIYKKQKRAHLERINKIKEMKEKLEQEGLLSQDSPIREELIRQGKDIKKRSKAMIYIIIIGFVILVVIKILLRIFGA